ncbi:MAG: hypothetical protein HC841_07050 [Verrucomicrobiae bacterium]|nr:hypothetical protein [Verrucomicrobiae bacterium]
MQNEEDVIANSVVQSVAGTNKTIVAGPLVPLGTLTRPIIYTIRAEINEAKTAIALVVAFDAPDQYQVFEAIVNEERKKIPVSPSLQQEIQGRKNTAYIVSLSDEYLQKASKTGIEWSFQGKKDTSKVKVPGFFFAGFTKKVAATKAALKPNTSDDSLVFTGSIGNRNDHAATRTTEFGDLKDFLGETLIFIPLSRRDAELGYGFQISGTDGRELPARNLAGKEIQLLTITKSELGRTFFGAKFTDQDGLVVASSYAALNPLRGLVPKSEVESARTELKGRALWLRTNRLLTYDAVAEQIESHRVKRLQSVSVERVVLGSSANPIRLILRTENGEQFFQEYTCLKVLFREIGASSFESLFYKEDPRTKFGWPDDIIRLIEDSKIRIGMTQTQVIAAWDEPEKKNTVSIRGVRLEQWIFGDQFVYFENGKYIDYQEFNSR